MDDADWLERLADGFEDHCLTGAAMTLEQRQGVHLIVLARALRRAEAARRPRGRPAAPARPGGPPGLPAGGFPREDSISVQNVPRGTPPGSTVGPDVRQELSGVFAQAGWKRRRAREAIEETGRS